MTQQNKNLLALLLLIVLCACQSVPGTPTAAPTLPADEGAEDPVSLSVPLVVYERAIVSAEIHEQWTIYQNGTILQDNGPQIVMPADAVDDLVARIEESGFFEMEDIYLLEDPPLDQPLYALSVWANGEIKTVVTMEGVPTRPESLSGLILYVDTLVHGGNFVSAEGTR